MKHGKEMEQIKFSGNGIRLLDLKREIADRKLPQSTYDYDLKITDVNSNEGKP